MTSSPKIEATDLAALICSKVCHDIINPVGAIINGLEVLGDDDGGDMKDMAMELIWKSAEAASSQLKFARFAFGAAGSAGALMDLGDIRQVATDYITTDKVTMDWTSPMGQLPKDDAKLLLNMIMIAPSTIVHGGTVSIVVDEDLASPRFTIAMQGRAAAIPDDIEALFRGDVDLDSLDARKIQPYFLGLVARSVGAEVAFRQIGEGAVEISATIAR
ncbi:Signal transduction histidine kinase [hydrothermal vent metagenome]|uniref:Signal transduction histidine kinase n=1 Tax=hydrothermal vent metagenome TaxID=652676 RepID=A0A3B0TKD4_9ZZZZ